MCSAALSSSFPTSLLFAFSASFNAFPRSCDSSAFLSNNFLAFWLSFSSRLVVSFEVGFSIVEIVVDDSVFDVEV
jgi:hypothetical protein